MGPGRPRSVTVALWFGEDGDRADVIERQTAETRFRELLESAPDAVVLVDERGQIMLVNRRTEELFGYKSDELIEREVELLVPERFRAGHLADRAGYLADARTREMGAGLELYGRRRDGSEFPVEIGLSPLLADGGRQVIAIVRDVSGRRAAERERMELALEQAALRRVAMLVARGAPAAEVFDAVASETKGIFEFDTATLLRLERDGTVTVAASVATLPLLTLVGDRTTPVKGGVVQRVARTGRPARIDGFEGEPGSLGHQLNELGYGGAAAAPISVEGRLWGVLRVAWSKERSVSTGAEDRLLQFSELIATALANAQAREELRRVAEEQAALRRVATLVARGDAPSAVFAAVAAEAGRVIPTAGVALVGRYDLDQESIEFVGAWSPAGEPAFVGTRVPLGGHNVATLVFEGNEPARADRIRADDTPATALALNWASSSAGAPITVDGRLWGVITVGAAHVDELPLGAEHRLAQFTELVASAISNAQARGDLGRVAEEQAALRRVATLVAEAAPPSAVLDSVAEEVGRLLAVGDAAVWRYLPGGTGEILSAWSQTGNAMPVGFRAEPTTGTLTGTVRETGRPARVDQYTEEAGGPAREIGVRSSVGAPITVEDELWGLIAVVSTGEEPPPPGTEDRLAAFTELVAAAIANTESRAQLVASRGRIVAAADEERGRVVRDLHDGAQQRLVHAVVKLKLAQRALRESDPDAGELLDGALREVEEANLELRELAHGILPAALRHGGLRAAVKAVVPRMSLPVTVDVSDERLPAGIEATAYFIVSEALTNVAKHAKASIAEVTARVERGAVRVEIVDDGIGGLRRTGISGLSGLEDRVSALGGSFIVESPPGHGTRVRALLPLPDRG